MELLTARFLLRDFVPGDAPAFEAYHADSRSLEFYGEDEASPGHAVELIDRFRVWSMERPRLNYQLAIVRRDEVQTLVGCCGLRSAGSGPGKAELGIELAPDYWGRFRYAIEVVRALVEFGFAEMNLREIYGGTVSANSRMARLARSFGATAVVLPTPEWMTAKGWTCVEWRISRTQWENGRLTVQLSDRRRLQTT